MALTIIFFKINNYYRARLVYTGHAHLIMVGGVVTVEKLLCSAKGQTVYGIHNACGVV
jgi:hypothetical protein